MSFLLSSCEDIPLESLPALPSLYIYIFYLFSLNKYLRQNLICLPASRLYLKKLLSILQTMSSAQDIPLSFFLEVAFVDKTYPNALRYLHTNRIRSRLAFMRRLGKHTSILSINNFSSYVISQSVDWECPSLSPHVLLIWTGNSR